jgi:hypothetical protein
MPGMRPQRLAESHSPTSQDFERHMLRLSVEDLTAERAHCADCGRSPLVGEDVHLYERGRVVCELCRQLRSEPPVSTQRVRYGTPGQSVRLRRA